MPICTLRNRILITHATRFSYARLQVGACSKVLMVEPVRVCNRKFMHEALLSALPKMSPCLDQCCELSVPLRLQLQLQSARLTSKVSFRRSVASTLVKLGSRPPPPAKKLLIARKAFLGHSMPLHAQICKRWKDYFETDLLPGMFLALPLGQLLLYSPGAEGSMEAPGHLAKHVSSQAKWQYTCAGESDHFSLQRQLLLLHSWCNYLRGFIRASRRVS